MKKLYTLVATILLTATTFAQAPEKMSYQAIIRNSGDALITNQVVGMQISILQTTATGTSVYTETQTPTTNINGLVTLEIGTGTTSDVFSDIDWSTGPYFIKTESDPAGGTNYTITGTSQLLSVPYALYAKTSGSGNYKGTSNTTLDWTSLKTDCNLGITWEKCFGTSTANLTTNETLSFTAGMRILVTSATDSNVYFVGTVQTYSANAMTVLIEYITDATGPLNNWVLNLGNGAQGVPGAMGDKGPGGFYSGGNLISISNNTYTVTDSFIYDGLNNFQGIQKAYVRASCDPGTTYDLRLYDYDNNIVIAEITGQSNNSPAIIDLGFIQYNTFNLTSIEIQAKRSSGTGQVLIYSVLVE